VTENRYLVFIHRRLRSQKSVLSPTLESDLEKRFRLSHSYAKTILSRLVKEGLIYSSYPLTFAFGALGISLEKGSNNFLNLLSVHKPYLLEIFSFLDAHSGVISPFEIKRLSACSSGKVSRGILTFQKVLSEISYFREISYSSDLQYYYLPSAVPALKEAVALDERRDQSDERIIRLCIARHLEDNLLFKKGTFCRNHQRTNPEFLGFSFDAFSFTNALSEKGHHVVLCYDVSSAEEYSYNRMKSLIARSERISYNKFYPKKAIPVAVYHSITPFTLSLAKKHGVLALSLSSLFGKIGEEIIRMLAATDCLENPPEDDTVAQILQKIQESGMESTFNQEKGDLFEYLSESIIRHIYSLSPSSVKRDVVITDGSKKREIDVVAYLGDATLLCECKGYSSKIKLGKKDPDSLEKAEHDSVCYFYETVQLYKELHPKEMIEACFFAANGFTRDAQSFLVSRVASTPRRLPADCSLSSLYRYYPKNQCNTFQKDYQVWEDYFINKKLTL
jgi:hypothetical protein